MKNRVAYFGVFTALALIFSYVETLIPINFGIPGVKLGLANLVIVIALYKMKLTEVCLWSEYYCQDSYLEIISVSFTAWPVDC